MIPQVEFEKAYEPFVEVKGLDCWPSEPRWEYLNVDGDELRKRGINFE